MVIFTTRISSLNIFFIQNELANPKNNPKANPPIIKIPAITKKSYLVSISPFKNAFNLKIIFKDF